MITKLLDLFGLVWKPYEKYGLMEIGTGFPLYRKKSVDKDLDRANTLLVALGYDQIIKKD